MKWIIAVCCILCLSSQLQAVTPSLINPGKFYISAGAGELFNNVSGNNSLNSGAGWPNDYYTTQSISNEPFIFIEGGYAWLRPQDTLPGYSVGLRYLLSSKNNISGTIDQYSLPQFRNYNYSYNVVLTNLMAIFKADLIRYQRIMPYVLAGAGAGIYTTSNYTEQAQANVTPRVNPNFASNSSTNFSYQFGAGLDIAIMQNLSVNVEYNYINYGTIQTGPGVNYATDTGTNYDTDSLKNKISTNSVLLGLTYSPE
jgi:opacity protein-like surface antigen